VDNQNFRIGVSMTVTDPDGKVFGGLLAENFEVFEDGQRVAIADFASAGQQPIRAALVVDRSGSMGAEGRLEGAKEAAGTFLGLARDRVDWLGLYAFSDEVEELLPIGPLDPESRARARAAITALRPGGGTELYKAILRALDRMRTVSGRRIILAMTDGRSDGTELIPQVIELSQELNIPLYTIGLGSEPGIDSAALRRLADATQGRYFHAPRAEELAELYRRIGESLQSEYSFGYDSPNATEDGLSRTVQVVVRRGDAVTTATGRYHVRGLVAVASRTRPATATESGPNEKPYFLSVFVPLALVLGLAFGIPYARSLRGTEEAASAAAPAGPAPAAPAPRTASAPPPTGPPASEQPQGDICPGGCGRIVPGVKGRRYCIVCDITY
jgi:VWFA-related protein